MEKTISILVSFVGYRDPYPDNPEQAEIPGPILSFLFANPVDEVHLLCSNSDYLERARDVEEAAREEGLTSKFYHHDFSLSDVVDYNEIWNRLMKTLEEIKKDCSSRLPARFVFQWLFLLDSGTPQMKNSLLLASLSGKFPAQLYQGIPPQFAGGAYKFRQVHFTAFTGGQGKPLQVKTESQSLSGTMLLGNAPAMKEVITRIERVSQYDTPVLLLGETGVGKTLIAKEIHQHSKRSTKAFIEINCSTIPAGMAESELFGHVQGAFTGAQKSRSGKFKAADGGTLFLDEIGDLPLEVQVKLLKVLEEKKLYPVGSDEAVAVDVRIIAATHRDLKEMVQQGTFRQDLYERLKVAVIAIPPLRERKEDIIDLAHYFMAEWNNQYHEKRSLSDAVLEHFMQYSWPGNIRELRNAIQSAACVSLSETIEREALPEEILHTTEARPLVAAATETDGSQISFSPQVPHELPENGINLRAKLLQYEWSYIAMALQKTQGNREQAARLLGMTGHALRKALRERLACFVDEALREE